MKNNDRIDRYMNETLHNVYVSSGIALLNIHSLTQANKSSKLDELNRSVENGGVNGDNFYTNGSTGCVINNHNYVDFKNKIAEISTNKYLR